ncbi:MAG: putative zinc-binding protein [Phycisphaerae bacterium]
MSEETSCACGAAPTLIFACSGAADVGEIADRAARRLARAGVGRMYCLAGVGGRVSGILASTQAAERILAIDGCPLACAKNTLEKAEVTRFQHVQLADLGMAKGKSPVSEDRVAKAADAGLVALGSQEAAS